MRAPRGGMSSTSTVAFGHWARSASATARTPRTMSSPESRPVLALFVPIMSTITAGSSGVRGACSSRQSRCSVRSPPTPI